ncbi:hypothetical protein CBS147332_3514 [Penicillium roqueforti]|nr:hypothetical protein CBS147332_3514 [Penicillium roqueforti]KAI3117302.1 hypothetical protein CBS147331_3777 [Penicillium roqueforti]
MPPRATLPRAAKLDGKSAPKRVNAKRKKSLKEDEGAAPKKAKTETGIPQLLNEELLAADLKVDYSKTWKKPRQEIPKKQKWPKVKNVITELEDTPKGWNPEEPDLMPDDFKAQIERCRERIAENIMPHVYRHKMKEFIAKQSQRERLMAREPGLSWPEAQRVDDLKFTLDQLAGENDEYKMVSTVKAIIARYRSGKLSWNPDLVTYWYSGVQLCLPRPFHWDEYRYVHDKYEGHVGFWVEGILGPGPSMSKASMVRVALRIPKVPAIAVREGERKKEKGEKDPKPLSRPPFFDFPFMDDTGATHMLLFEDDINVLRNLEAESGPVYPLPRCMGVGVLYLADGNRVTSIFREIEVNMWSYDERKWMSPDWQAISACVQSGQSTRAGADRLLGSWLRHRFYTGTCPDQSLRLWVFDYNPGIPQGQRTLPTATPAQLNAPYPVARVRPIDDFPHLDPNLATGHGLF